MAIPTHIILGEGRRFSDRRSNHLFGRLNASCYISSAVVLEEETDQIIRQQ